ncbi:MAG: type II secretion system F family protein [Anaerolineae bacterium]|jgi:tight adherence protein C|nr:type II secretion system F family protein [Anaerolineae bacterium]MDH7473534.1 type II secretion system F family protein [Anaerolineae bacterium]
MGVQQLLIIGLALFMGLGAIILILVGTRGSATERVEARLAEYGSRAQPVTLEELELAQPFSQRIVRPMVSAIAKFIARFTPQQSLEATRHKLELAGRPNNWGPAEFWGVRALAGVLMALLVFLLLSTSRQPLRQSLLYSGLMGALGFYLPVAWLGSKIRKRQDEIIKALPDALDLLTICVEAGLGFDAAMSKVTEKWDNELSRAFGRAIQEIRLGKLRREALRSMADSVGVTDLSSFVAAVIQADQLGVSIAKVLRIQSEQMRIKRRQRAEELARKAPVKMMIPLILLIFPSIYIILLGPAILLVMETGVLGSIF